MVINHDGPALDVALTAKALAQAFLIPRLRGQDADPWELRWLKPRAPPARRTVSPPTATVAAKKGSINVGFIS